MRSQNILISFAETFKINYAGLFFNNFLPGSVGGDIVKAIVSAKADVKKAKPVATVLLDRILGLVVLLSMACVAGLICLRWVELRNIVIMVFVLTCLVIGFYLFYFSNLFRGSKFFIWLKEHLPYRNVLRDIDATFKSVNKKKGLIIVCVLLSLSAQVICVFINFILANSLGMSVLLGYMFLFIPLVLIVNAIPISFGGWGIGECSYAFFLKFAGVEASQAIALSIIYKICWILISIPGGIIFALGFARVPPKPVNAPCAHEKTA